MIPCQFSLNFVVSKIVIVGAGGIGGRVVPLLSQLVASMRQSSPMFNPVIYVIDFDIVEEKNLKRQNFIKSDVGKYKAKVLADRYSKAFGVSIIPILDKIPANNEDIPGPLLDEFFPHSGKNSYSGIPSIVGKESPTFEAVWILALDSAKARRDTVNFIYRSVIENSSRYEKPMGVVIDAGNENDFGQVSISSIMPYYIKSQFHPKYDGLDKPRFPIVVPGFPLNLEHYENLQDMPSAGSCAVMDQTLAINNLVAAQVVAYTQELCMGKPISVATTRFSLSGDNSRVMMDLEDRTISSAKVGHKLGYSWLNWSRAFDSWYYNSCTEVTDIVAKGMRQVLKKRFTSIHNLDSAGIQHNTKALLALRDLSGELVRLAVYSKMPEFLYVDVLDEYLKSSNTPSKLYRLRASGALTRYVDVPRSQEDYNTLLTMLREGVL